MWIQRTENLFVTKPGMGHASVNQVGYSTHLANANFTDVVAPNADTLYNTAWLELGEEPIVLHVPAPMGGTMSSRCLMHIRIPSTAWVNGPLVQEKAISPLLGLIGTAACPQDSR